MSSFWNRLFYTGIPMLSASLHPFASDPHSRIHQGKMFCACHINTNVADNANLDLLLTTPAAIFPHLVIFPSASGLCDFFLYEEPTASGGNAVEIMNQKRTSTHTFGGTVTSGPSVSAVGTQLSAAVMPGGQKNSAVGSSEGFEMEWILKASTKYLTRITNRSGGAARISLSLCFYESPQINDV